MEHSTEYSGSAYIVVGVDGSDNSERAFEVALGIAQQRQLALRMVTAYTEPGYEYLPENTQGLAQENAQEVMDDLIATAKDVDVAISSVAIEGDAAGVIIRESKNAALVVVGKRGRSRFAGRFLGSVSASVASHAHCPSLVVPGRGKRKELPESDFAGPADKEETAIGVITSEGVATTADFRDCVVVAVDLDIQPVDLVATAAQYAEERDLNLVLINAQPFSGSLWMPVSPVYQAEVPDLRKNVADRIVGLLNTSKNKPRLPSNGDSMMLQHRIFSPKLPIPLR